MAVIARWTTPAISFKPSMVEPENISEIKCVLTQNGVDLIVKTLEDATINEGRFIWQLTQEESALLATHRATMLQFDYLATSGMRYTTIPQKYDTMNSATDEAM